MIIIVIALVSTFPTCHPYPHSKFCGTPSQLLCCLFW